MIKNCKIAVFVILTLLLNACSRTVVISEAAPSNARVDGQRSEWAGRFQIPRGEKFAFGISHDKNYLYIAVSSIDRGIQRQIAQRGLTIWLDAKGGKRQNLGISFEGKRPRGKKPAFYQRQQKKATDWLGKDTRFEEPVGIDGDLPIILYDTKAGKSMGPADLLATARSRDGSLFIEYQVPRTLLGAGFDLQKLGLGFESTLAKSPRHNAPHGGMAGSGKGNRAGGMEGAQRQGARPSGGPVGRGLGRNDLEVWVKVQISP